MFETSKEEEHRATNTPSTLESKDKSGGLNREWEK